MSFFEYIRGLEYCVFVGRRRCAPLVTVINIAKSYVASGSARFRADPLARSPILRSLWVWQPSSQLGSAFNVSGDWYMWRIARSSLR